MPRRKLFDKKTSTTFALVHRAQDDPLIHDADAPSMVFAEKQQQQPKARRVTDEDYAYSSASSVFSSDSSYRSKKTKQRGDLEDEFGLSFRPNEGQAAEHGVFFDDTEYDYMQHMRDLGSGQGAVTWVEASQQQKRAKNKEKLEDVLRNMNVQDEGFMPDDQSVGTTSSAARSLLPEEVLPSEFVRKLTYQDQQDVPDDIAGFQPDMDPRLREVLEALEDEAYVDDEDDEDVFGQLTGDGVEVDRSEWDRLGEQQMFDEDGELDDDGWESDDTNKPANSPHNRMSEQILNDQPSAPPVDAQAPIPADPTAGAWLDEFRKFKSGESQEKASSKPKGAAAPSALESSALSSLASGRRKKRKGAKTSTSNYSMSSSALVRTDQQTLLDARFDKIEEEYAADEMTEEEGGLPDDAMSSLSGVSGISKQSRMSKYSNASGLSGVSGISSYSRASDAEAPQLERTDFNSIMDEFLGGYSKSGKMGRRVKRGGPQTGMQQLDEIRAGLGPARVKSTARAV
jgi:protein LTV1